jgi:tyrosinase
MNPRPESSVGATRREFLARSAAGAAVLYGLGGASSHAARPGGHGARFRRYSLAETKPEAQRDLDSYERAVTKMLELPPTDPRNWFRIAVVHLLDCPHGNWWFLPWHRGFLGYFEMICRELSEDDDFALPYWDWTADPQLPARFLNGALNPANFSIRSVVEFRTKFETPIQAFWDGMTGAQKTQLQLRRINTITDLWNQIEGKFDPTDTAVMFPVPADARKLNPPHTQKFDERTARAVSISTILDALAPRDFEGFGSGRQANHHLPFTSEETVFGVLESQPHNLVHNEVGGYIRGTPSRQGFMSAFLSPSDPIFYMHHSNIDRLWDVWTRKQAAQNSAAYRILPPAADVPAWNSEPFLFFVGADGNPAPKSQSGDFNEIANFNYDYQPGSGDIVVPRAPPTAGVAAARSFSASVAGMTGVSAVPANLAVALPADADSIGGLRLVAVVTVELPDDARDLRLHAILNPPPGLRSISPADPGYVGTFELFGGHGHGAAAAGAAEGHPQRPKVTFSLGLTDAAVRLRGTARLKPGDPLNLRIVADTAGLTLEPVDVKVLDVTIKAL